MIANMEFPAVIKSIVDANSHMFLIQNSDNQFSLIPPNQCDWVYTITRVLQNTWNVKGKKSDVFMGDETYEENYVL